MRLAIRRIASLALGAALLFALDADRADACSIILPVAVLPGAAPAGLDAHVWFYNPPFYGLDDFPLKPGRMAFVLRPAGTNGDADVALAAFLRDDLLELAPPQRLAPRTRYEVWFVMLATPKKEASWHMATSFVTGDAIDVTPPPKPQLTSALVWDDSPRAGVLSLCGNNSFDVSLTVKVSRERAPEATLLAVWTAGDDGNVRYEGPPAGIFAASAESYFHQGNRLCSASDKTCKDYFLHFIRGRRIGVRAFDASGNLSEPSEVMVESR